MNCLSAIGFDRFGPGVYVFENYRIFDFFTQQIAHFGPYALSGQGSKQGAPTFGFQTQRISCSALTKHTSRAPLFFSIKFVEHIAVNVRTELL